VRYAARRFVHHRLYSTFFLDFLSRLSFSIFFLDCRSCTHRAVEEPDVGDRKPKILIPNWQIGFVLQEKARLQSLIDLNISSIFDCKTKHAFKFDHRSPEPFHGPVSAKPIARRVLTPRQAARRS
jgi:hypothetical protein